MSPERERAPLPPILHRRANRPAAEHLAASRQTALAKSQSAAAIPSRWQTALGIDFETFPNDVTKGLRNRLIEFAERPSRFARALPQLSHGGVGFEGNPATEDFVKDDADGEEIRARIEGKPLGLFG